MDLFMLRNQWFNRYFNFYFVTTKKKTKTNTELLPYNIATLHLSWDRFYKLKITVRDRQDK